MAELERCRLEGSTDGGVRVAGGSRAALASSLVANHGGPCISADPGATLDLLASTVTRCPVGVRSTVATTTRIAGSIVHGNSSANLEGVFCSGVSLSATASDCCAGGRNICTDPRFVDPAGGDFRLRGDSPCLDSGATLEEYTGVPCVDLAGAPRLVDGNGDGVPRADRGAFERPNPGAGVTVADLRFDGPYSLSWTPGSATTLRVYRGDLSGLGYADRVTCIGEASNGGFDLAADVDPAPGEGAIYVVGASATAAPRATAPGTCAERRAVNACP